jgi:hypothetical protein
MKTVRHNWFAIALATLVYFLLGGVWFQVFLPPWLAATGYVWALATTLVLAVFMSWAIQVAEAQTVAGGLKVAAWTWVGVVLPTWSTEYAFEARTLQLLAINTGYCLIGMLLMGAILGGWMKRVR